MGVFGFPRRLDRPHGDILTYKTGCRCVPCTEANRAYAAAYRALNGVKRTKAQRRAEKRYDRSERGIARFKRKNARRTAVRVAARAGWLYAPTRVS